jgi:metal-dependent amidase/aminoacylase/carboxypeptidase family protein
MSLANDPTIVIRDATQRIEAALIEIRREIHASPELGFEEVRTPASSRASSAASAFPIRPVSVRPVWSA